MGTADGRHTLKVDEVCDRQEAQLIRPEFTHLR